MHDASCVDVIQRRRKLRHPFHDLSLCWRVSLDVCLQVSVFVVVHDDVELVIDEEVVQATDDVRVAELFQTSRLCRESVFISLFCLLCDFDSNLFSRLQIDASVAVAEGPRPDYVCCSVLVALTENGRV